jgi:hypothetical protein
MGFGTDWHELNERALNARAPIVEQFFSSTAHSRSLTTPGLTADRARAYDARAGQSEGSRSCKTDH